MCSHIYLKATLASNEDDINVVSQCILSMLRSLLYLGCFINDKESLIGFRNEYTCCYGGFLCVAAPCVCVCVSPQWFWSTCVCLYMLQMFCFSETPSWHLRPTCYPISRKSVFHHKSLYWTAALSSLCLPAWSKATVLTQSQTLLLQNSKTKNHLFSVLEQGSAA